MRQKNVSLAKYTYMRVGGVADWVTEATSIDELTEAVVSAQSEKIPYIVIGGGSNLIFTDRGFRGVVIVNRSNQIRVDESAKRIVTDSGVSTNKLVDTAITAGLAGIEGLMGIPGSVGGAVYNNAHFGTSSIGETVTQVTVLNSAGEREIIPRTKLEFGYDTSLLQCLRSTILSVELSLTRGDPHELRAKSNQSQAYRRETQPLEYPSSGCMFKNCVKPNITRIISAGAVIDQAGLKGMRVGGAMVSSKHANFIINQGNATAQDVIDISNQVIETVYKQSQIMLEREVFIINEFGERINP